PLVAAELSCAGTPRLRLVQRRYVPKGGGPSDETWQIPICARWPGGRACTIMSGRETALELAGAKSCPPWVYANVDAIGYYRVQYRGDGLARLLAGGGTALTVAERVGLAGDMIALVRAGQLREAEALTHSPTLARDANRHLVSIALDLVTGLEDH